MTREVSRQNSGPKPGAINPSEVGERDLDARHVADRPDPLAPRPRSKLSLLSDELLVAEAKRRNAAKGVK
jgi:hypothetical protein